MEKKTRETDSYLCKVLVKLSVSYLLHFFIDSWSTVPIHHKFSLTNSTYRKFYEKTWINFTNFFLKKKVVQRHTSITWKFVYTDQSNRLEWADAWDIYRIFKIRQSTRGKKYLKILWEPHDINHWKKKFLSKNSWNITSAEQIQYTHLISVDTVIKTSFVYF